MFYARWGKTKLVVTDEELMRILALELTRDRLALLNADMKCPPREVGQSSPQPFSPRRGESGLLSPLLLGEG